MFSPAAMVPSAPASQPQPAVSPASPFLDIDRLWQRYLQHRDPVPPGVHDLSHVLYALLNLIRDTSGADEERQLHEIAMLLSRCSRLILPVDPGIREMAHSASSLVLAMLAPGGTQGPRAPGVQVALDELATHWKNALTDRRAAHQPVVIVKSVPLHEPLLICPAVVTGVSLGPLQPPLDGFLARTPAPPPVRVQDGARVPQQPLLAITRAGDRLRIEVAPQDARAWQADGSRLQEVLHSLEFALMLSMRQGKGLEAAVQRFNRGVAPPLHLTTAPALSESARCAALQPEPGSYAESILWFDYAWLQTPGSLDEAMRCTDARDRLDAVRRSVQDAAEVEINQLQPYLPAAFRPFRAALVVGCAIQLCLEAAGRHAPLGTDFHFLVPAHELSSRMTSTERTLVQSILASLVHQFPTLDLAWMNRPAHGRPSPTYVSMDRGSPMGCVAMRTPRTVGADDARSEGLGMPLFEQLVDHWGEDFGEGHLDLAHGLNAPSS